MRSFSASSRRGIASSRVLAASFLLLAALGFAACGGRETAAPPAPPMRLSPENVVAVERARLETGPVLSGTLAADVSATVRSEVSGTVLEVRVEEGQRVGSGAVLARVDAPALRQGVLSAESALRAAEQQAEVARRNATRAESLLVAGAVPQREVEVARWSAMSAEAAAADAQSRLAVVREQVAKTVLRAPIPGVVSRRAVSAGDTVGPGAEMVTIVDLSMLRLAATVPAERVADLRVGAPVVFRLRGYADETFTGAIERINPVADPATRQLELYVKLPNPAGRLVAGLFAEGRVLTQAHEGLSLPATAIDESGVAPAVLRVRDGRTERVEVVLGLRDEVAERVEIVSGLELDDLVVTGAAVGLAPGTAVELVGLPG